MLNGFKSALRASRRGGLKLASVLRPERIEAAMISEGYRDRGSVYTAVNTVLTFLSQLLSADGSCQQAVSGLIAQRVVDGQSACSADTGGYCKARDRLPERAFEQLVRQTGDELDRNGPKQWRWLSKRVHVVDGSTLKIADTDKNRREYPLQEGLIPGTSYPIVRVLVVFSLAAGTVLDAALRPYKGKGTGETGMLRDLQARFEPGDVLLGDCYFAGYWDIAWWKLRGVEVVTRSPKSRRSDFRRGKRLGKDDHLIQWRKTAQPEWIDPDTAEKIPDKLTVREVRVPVTTPGFRTKEVFVITTLTDAIAYPKHELAALYRCRWQAELNLRSLKTHMNMEQLRCKTPSRVRKEFFTYLIAYNCVRKIGTLAALHAGQHSSNISFKATMQAMNEFFPRLTQTCSTSRWTECMLDTIATVIVGLRPDRIEPYVTKTRPKDYPCMKETRRTYKNRFPGRL